MATNDIKKTMGAHVKELMSLPGVVGVGIGVLDNGSSCIKVMVVKKNSELEKKIPDSLEGYPVMITETGKIRSLTGKLN